MGKINPPKPDKVSVNNSIQVQRKKESVGNGVNIKSSIVQRSLQDQAKLKSEKNSASDSKTQMSASIQAKMENSFGADFSNVNIHEGESASAVNALAYTQGNDIHFAPGQYNPETRSGQELLGHELTHVIQQRKGNVQSTIQSKGVGINDDKGLEQEADEMGSKAASSEIVQKKSISESVSSNNLAIQRTEGTEDETPKDINNSYKEKTFKISDANAKVRNDDLSVKKYKADDTIPEGKKEGDDIVVPKDTEVTITDTKLDSSGKLYIYVDGYGWTSSGNVQGSFINETIGISKATWESEDPKNKTIGDSAASIREFKGYLFEERKPKVVVPKDSWVIIGEESEDGKFVKVASEPGTELGWTSKGNIDLIKTDPAHPGAKQVKDPDARLRDKAADYKATGQDIAQGSYVIVKEESQNTEPKGKFVKVASVKKVEGANVEDKELGWTSSGNLVDGWADYKGDNAEWENGNYIGQADLVNIVGVGGEIKKMGLLAVDKYQEMISAASSAGVTIKLNSGFRNMAEQKYLYDHQNEDGFNPANRPGTSNHQKGKAFDLNNRVDADVNDWLNLHAWKFGFIKPYQAAKEAHHWEYRPNEIKQPEIVEINNIKYRRTFWGIWNTAYTDTKI